MAMTDSSQRDVRVSMREPGLWAVQFAAMASPCELLLAAEPALVQRLAHLAAEETWRIEAKFSRYRADSVISRINTAHGATITVDDETAGLLNFAAQCYALSDGRFDITSGVLRRLWRFEPNAPTPTAEQIQALMPLVSFAKLHWQAPLLTLPAGMELDFGGIGKEYAVDRVFQLLRTHTDAPLLVNFGGDLRASEPPASGPWRVGVERPGVDGAVQFALAWAGGGLATSGNTKRFVMHEGVRYGHILDPRTGWPVPSAPLSVTVSADNCTMAGMYCTLAMLHGKEAEAFLRAEQVQHWILR